MVQQHSQLFHVVLLLHLYLSHQQAPDSTNTKHQVVKLCMFRTFWQFAQIWNCVVHSVNCQIACQFINCVRDFEIMQSTVQFRNGCFWARYAPVLDTVHGKLAAVPWWEGLACTRNFININLFWKRGFTWAHQTLLAQLENSRPWCYVLKYQQNNKEEKRKPWSRQSSQ